MDKIEELKQLVESLTDDCDKFYNKSNKSAGTRIRKVMQEIKVLAQDIRKDVQTIKNEG